MNYRIAIIDDHRFVRDGLRDCVRAWTKGQVVLEAENGLDYEQRLPETGHVHLALVDLRMPKRDGCETMRWMARHQKRTLALAFSFEITTANVVRALRAGARGFMDKGQSHRDWHAAFDDLVLRGFHYNEHVSRALVRSLRTEAPDRHPDALWAKLTAREREFLLLYTSYLKESVEDIARRMGVERSTAETYRSSVAHKIEAPSRAEMVAMVKDHGWEKRVW